MNTLGKVLLFASSYIPLLALLAIRVWPQNRFAAVALVVVAAVLASLTWYLVDQLRSGGREELIVTETRPRAESLSGYLVGYILPFVVLDARDIFAVASVVAFLVLLAWVHIASGLLYLNPVLALFGHHVWEVAAARPDGVGKPTRMILIADSALMHADEHYMTRPIVPGIRWAERIDDRI